MIHVKLGEEFREPLDKIKGYFPNTSYTHIITNIINSYLPIYSQGIESLHNPQLTVGKAEAGIGVTTSTKPPVNPYLSADPATKTDSAPKKAPEHHQENDSEKNQISEEIPEELENLFD